MSDKTLYCVSGEVKGFPKPIQEYVYAYSPAQAKKLVAQRLERKYTHMRIYLGHCAVAEIKKEEKAEQTADFSPTQQKLF